ncbi:putative quarternary ammonium transport protein (fragment) [Escherichia coli]|uniref:Putative quarternary ammonium transport protein n=1 Tax=Escherichia coli TaxID=562 RepID=A0A2X1K8R2_ECOLX
MGLVIYLATSKYGNIRLGEGKPEYSTLSWLFMFICAGLGSSTPLLGGLLNGPIIIKHLD